MPHRTSTFQNLGPIGRARWRTGGSRSLVHSVEPVSLLYGAGSQRNINCICIIDYFRLIYLHNLRRNSCGFELHKTIYFREQTWCDCILTFCSAAVPDDKQKTMACGIRNSISLVLYLIVTMPWQVITKCVYVVYIVLRNNSSQNTWRTAIIFVVLFVRREVNFIKL